MQRQSNNFRPQFTDEECITVYLWGISQRRFELKAIYDYTKNHLLEWFPKLPSYQAFDRRVGALGPAFGALAEIWLDQISAHTAEKPVYIVDSCPIILAKGPRSGRAKVASEMCSKSYNSSRKEWYYGAKLHAFVSSRIGRLPTPTALIVSDAAEHDLTAAKQITMDYHPLKAGTLYADKAYADADWRDTLQQEHIQILTPRKKRKGDSIVSGDAFSTFVSIIRQPIESFFNWLDYHTNIQSASFVRSGKGLLSHIFGRLAAALSRLFFNS